MTKNRILLLSAGLCTCLLLGLACSPSTNSTSKDMTHSATFPAFGKMEEVGLDRQRINALVDSIESGSFPNRHSLLIYKDGQLVLEKYFSGKDEIWGIDRGVIEFSDTTLHDVRSISKSFVSAAIGIAIDQELIKNIDQRVFDFFPEYAVHRNNGREELTIEHLLTMTSGLEWNEEVPYDNPENSEVQMINSPDGIEFVLSRRLVATPGTQWRYNGGTTEVLAAIIEKVSGQNIYEFCKKNLFEPLEINNSYWSYSPSTGKPAAASGLRLTPRDLLKFGTLYLNDGIWKGKQIIPEKWVSDSLLPWIARSDGGGYGYQFWVFDFVSDSAQSLYPAAVGNGDQRLFFDAKDRMVVVTTAGNYNQWEIKNNATLLFRGILASKTKN